MTPAFFFQEVATANVDALASEVGNLRLAVNAILSLDALVGVIHVDLVDRGQETADDAAFRDRLAAQHLDYGIVRDAAFALKHGELRYKKPRLVRRADQVKSYGGVYDEAVFDRSVYDTNGVIWIEANDPSHSRRADQITRSVLDSLRAMV